MLLIKLIAGTENSYECMTESIQESVCPVKCSVGSLANLPKCNTSSEVDCIMTNTMDYINKCSESKRGLTFNGDLEELETYSNESNETVVDIFLNAKKKEVREEVDIITTSGFIGSVGGSLGMFFGFSISAYAITILDSLTKRLNTLDS